jgi:hypothetical protein
MGGFEKLWTTTPSNACMYSIVCEDEEVRGVEALVFCVSLPNTQTLSVAKSKRGWTIVRAFEHPREIFLRAR